MIKTAYFTLLLPALSVVAVVVMFAFRPARTLSSSAVMVSYRSFSASAGIDPSMTALADRFARLTDELDLGQVRLTRLPGLPPVPDEFRGDVVAEVAAGSLDAAYVSGVELSPAWGFLVNSGYPMGPSFDQFLGFLLGRSVDGGRATGAELVQEMLDRRSRGVVALPVAAAPEQLSGYFPEPIGDVPTQRGIGLTGLCQRSWVLRFLPPAQDVLERACADRELHPALSFVQAVPGGGSLTAALRAGQISGFEFATPLDDLSSLFSPLDDPGSAGAGFVHAPGWHQRFLITWLVIGRKVWDHLGMRRQDLLRTVALGNVATSYAENSRRQGWAIRRILGTDDLSHGVVLSRWPDVDLATLRAASRAFIESRRTDPRMSQDDRDDYVRVVDALLDYLQDEESYEPVRRMPEMPEVQDVR